MLMRSVMRKIADNRSESSIAHALRRRRFDRLYQLLSTVERPFRILDIGGTQDYWDFMGFRDPAVRIVLVNRSLQHINRPDLDSVIGDARSLAEFGDRSFDIVFSNSVIEHLGDLSSQKAMAREVRRVGRRYWIQTPNRHFPIEAHALLPFYQYLPVRARSQLAGWMRPGWYRELSRREAADEARAVRLLTAGEMQALFGDGTIWRERVCGVTKSLIAYAGFGQPG